MNAPACLGPLSLSGVPLEGNNLVRLVYVDEAGISRPREEPFLVVAAILVDADRTLVAVERHLDRLVARHIPEGYREGFVFHAHEIFKGRGKVFDAKNDPNNPRWDLPRRLALADDLAAIPKKFNLPIAFGIVERANFPTHPDAKAHFAKQSFAEQVVTCHVTAFMSCALGVEHWMRANAPGEVCLMIAEDNAQARNLIRETQNYHQDPKKMSEMTEEEARYFPLKKIKEDPLFQPKKASSILQVADFCAYVIKRIMMDDPIMKPRFTDALSAHFARHRLPPLKKKRR